MGVERKNDREGMELSRGVWLALVAHAVIMVGMSQFAYTTAMTIWRILCVIILASCLYFWKKTTSRNVARSFTFVMGIVSVAILLLSLTPTGVTEWN